MIKICFDAGHGASTPGKRSPDGIFREYKFNRQLTSKIIKLFEPYKEQITCYVTQELTNDYDLSLPKRCEMANRLKADYFVSIHANGYYFKDSKGKDKEEYNSVRGWEIYVVSKGGRAEELAKYIRYSTLNHIPKIVDRGIKVANFAVLRGTNMPAVLIESGFYTNIEEKILLESEEYQNTLAKAYVEGILNYLKIPIIIKTEEDKIYKVQVGAYKNKENAENRIKELEKLGIESYLVVEGGE